MEFLSEYGIFLLKALTIVIAILAVFGGIMALSLRHRDGSDERLEITNINEKYEHMTEALDSALLDRYQLKQKAKAEKKKAKEKAKQLKKLAKKAAKDSGNTPDDDFKKRLFVIDFDGDIQATPVNQMREEISAILSSATEKDEVLLRLESGGGAVHGYGLAASQLQRIRDKGIPLTISVDKVAASGGYMMACVADKIIAAPFSIIGSIGVVAQMPNLHRVLQKNDIDYEQLTAGEYKRTLTVFGENTDEARAKMQEELEDVHTLFKQFVSERRPSLEIDKVATGEHWLGTRAKELGLVDELVTSDDYLMSALEEADIITISYSGKKTLMEKIKDRMAMLATHKNRMERDAQLPRLM